MKKLLCLSAISFFVLLPVSLHAATPDRIEIAACPSDKISEQDTILFAHISEVLAADRVDVCAIEPAVLVSQLLTSRKLGEIDQRLIRQCFGGSSDKFVAYIKRVQSKNCAPSGPVCY